MTTPSNLLKSFFITSLLFVSLQTRATNVTIIESLSGNFWATQDSVWYVAAINLGYTAAIVPQSALDNVSNFNSTDILVVSSGTINFTGTNHLSTIINFVLNGGATYIQSEYQPYYQGVKTFDTLMQVVGANFMWLPSVSGNLSPMNVLGTFATTPNSVAPLTYFNYGLPGTGTGVQPFLEFQGNNYGFLYFDESSGYGPVITVSDEDWCWHQTSIPLMENILYALAHPTTTAIAQVESDAAFSVFPNPFAEQLNFKFNKTGNYTIELINLTGEVVETKNGVAVLANERFSLDAATLKSGVYFLKVTGERSESIKRLIHIEQQ